MPEITFIVDELRGGILVEDNQDLSRDAVEHLRAHLGEAQEIGCARPIKIIEPSVASSEQLTESVSVRIAGFYHDSLTEGPGRRSSVLFQYCPLKCKGCWVTNLHPDDAGMLVSVNRLADELLDPKYERDGVTILGGEPFAQAPGTLRSRAGIALEELSAHCLLQRLYPRSVARESRQTTGNRRSSRRH